MLHYKSVTKPHAFYLDGWNAAINYNNRLFGNYSLFFKLSAKQWPWCDRIAKARLISEQEQPMIVCSYECWSKRLQVEKTCGINPNIEANRKQPSLIWAKRYLG